MTSFALSEFVGKISRNELATVFLSLIVRDDVVVMHHCSTNSGIVLEHV